MRLDLEKLLSFLEKEENKGSASEEKLSLIDLIHDYESGVVIKDKAPNRILSYSKQAPPGNGFTGSLKKKALGLLDMPSGRPDGNDSNRPRESFKEQDEEVSKRFFGGSSDANQQESLPSANIKRRCDKPINIPDENEIDNFFSYLGFENISKEAKNNNLGVKMNKDQEYSSENKEVIRLAKALRSQGFDKKAEEVVSLIKSAEEIAPQWAGLNKTQEAHWRTMVARAKRIVSTTSSTVYSGALRVDDDAKYTFIELAQSGVNPAEYWSDIENWKPSTAWAAGGDWWVIKPKGKLTESRSKKCAYPRDVIKSLTQQFKADSEFQNAGAELLRYTLEKGQAGDGNVPKAISVKYLVPDSFGAGDPAPQVTAVTQRNLALIALGNANRDGELADSFKGKGEVMDLKLLETRFTPKYFNKLKLFSRKNTSAKTKFVEVKDENNQYNGLYVAAQILPDGTVLFAVRDGEWMPLKENPFAKSSSALDHVVAFKKSFAEEGEADAFRGIVGFDGENGNSNQKPLRQTRREELDRVKETLQNGQYKKLSDNTYVAKRPSGEFHANIEAEADAKALADGSYDPATQRPPSEGGGSVERPRRTPGGSRGNYAARVKEISKGKVFDQASGDKFRDWMHADGATERNKWANSNQLSPSDNGRRGRVWNNKYMYKALDRWGEEYLKHLDAVAGSVVESGGQGRLSAPPDSVLKSYILMDYETRQRIGEANLAARKKMIDSWDGRTQIMNPGQGEGFGEQAKGDADYVLASSSLKEAVIKAFREDNKNGALEVLSQRSQWADRDAQLAKQRAEADEAAAAERAAGQASLSSFYIAPFGGGTDDPDLDDEGYPVSGTIFVRKSDGEVFYLGRNRNGERQLFKLQNRPSKLGLDDQYTPANVSSDPGRIYLSEAEQEAIWTQVPGSQRSAWKNFLDQQYQAYESRTEEGRGVFHQSTEKEFANYDEARRRMRDEGIFAAPKSGQPAQRRQVQRAQSGSRADRRRQSRDAGVLRPR